jgi:hypothetical protein
LFKDILACFISFGDFGYQISGFFAFFWQLFLGVLLLVVDLITCSSSFGQFHFFLGHFGCFLIFGCLFKGFLDFWNFWQLGYLPSATLVFFSQGFWQQFPFSLHLWLFVFRLSDYFGYFLWAS